MTLFKELKISSSHLIGNREEKKLTSIFKEDQSKILFGPNKKYKLNKCKGKICIYSYDEIPIFFIFGKLKPIPVINSLIRYPILADHTIFLDNGALKPIMQGADIMAPGIYKYKEKIKNEFFINDIICIYIIDLDYIAVGVAKIDYNQINENTKGIAINVLHRKGDKLYDLNLL